jgi:hypothetical protein
MSNHPETNKKIMIEKIKDFFTENPEYFGFFFVFVGVLCLVSAIKDANWLFGNVSGVDYNLKKIDGWVNFFGRKTARVIAGIMSVLTILAGIVWFCAYAYYYK